MAKKYMLTFRDGKGMGATAEEQQKLMAAWGAWYGTVGAALVDGGAPFGASQSVSTNGGTAPALGGYAVVSAGSIDEAAKHAKSSPVYADGGSVDVYELIEMSM